MRKYLKTLLLLAAAPLLFACNTTSFTNSSEISPSNSEDGSDPIKQDTLIHIIDLPSEAIKYPAASLFIKDREVPLLNVKVNDSHVYQNPDPSRIDAGYGRLYMRGQAQFVLKTKYDITPNTKIYPSSFHIVPTHDVSKREITFTIYEPGVYAIVTNDNEHEAIHLRIFDLSEMEQETITNELGRIISFGAGMHSKANSEFIDANNYINVNDNDIVFIAEGAIVNARIKGDHVENVRILGHGIISGSEFSRTNAVVPIDFTKSSNLMIRDISIIDPAAWTLNLYFVEDSEINNVSIISSRANGDGVTLQSCTNIIVKNVFVRAFDDALVVKNYAYPYGNADRSTHGSTNNILFDNCYLWVDLAQAMEIGYETVGAEMNDITFQNITVFYANHKPVISIHNANYADLHRIVYKNITVENLNTGQGDARGNNELIDIQATYSSAFSDKPLRGVATEIGNIDDLTIENVLVKRKDSQNNGRITIIGQKDSRIDFRDVISTVNNVKLSAITIINNNVSDSYKYLTTNEYVTNLLVTSAKATGHNIIRHYDSDFYDGLSENIIFM